MSLHPDLTDDPFEKLDAQQDDFLARLEKQALAENPELVVDRARSSSVEAIDDPRETSRMSEGLSALSALPSSAEEDNAGNGVADQTMEDVANGNGEASTSDSDTDEGASDNGSVALDEPKKTVESPKDGTPRGTSIVPEASTSKLPATNGTKSEGESTSNKKKRKAKDASPPPKVAKPQTTIRLSFDLNKPPSGFGKQTHKVPSSWEFNIREIAADQNQIVHQSEAEESSHSSDDSAADKKGKSAISASTIAILGNAKGLKKKGNDAKRKRVIGRFGGYDTDDSFVDDSELHLDLVQTYAVPAKNGFFIVEGPVELLEEKPEAEKPPPRTRTKPESKSTTKSEQPAKKKAKTSDNKSTPKEKVPPAPPAPKGRILPAAGHTPRMVAPFGGNARAESPAVPSSSVPAATPSSSKKDAQLEPLPQELQDMIEAYKPLVAKESFVPKNKFPPALEAPLFAMSFVAIRLGHYDENYFTHLTHILPYNKFTLTKLVKRKIFPHRMKEMQERQAALKEDLKKGIERNMKASRDAYATALTKYSEERSKWQAEQESLPNASQQDGEKDDGPQPPKQKFKMDEEMRQALFEICTIESSMVDLQVDKLTLEKSDEKPPTENTARKNLYAELVSFWPEGWITSSELSRGWSQQRKKFLSK